MEYLKNNNTGTDEVISNVRYFLASQEQDIQEFYKQIVTKSLKIGCDVKTLNKIYGENFIATFNVMLANKFEEHKHKIKGDFVITKKLDGSRLVIIKENGIVKSYTRTGKQYEGLEEIERDISSLNIDNVVFDGELLADTTGTTQEVYAETMSKSRKKGSNKTGLIYHIFDVLHLVEFVLGLSANKAIERKNVLSEIFLENKEKLTHCKEVEPLYIGRDLSKIDELMQYAQEQEWEGLMLNTNTPYEGRRTENILKIKLMKDADLLVTNTYEGTGKNVGKLGGIEVEFIHNNEKHRCNCGSGFNDEERELYFKNPELIVGKIVTIQYFEISKNDGGGYGLRFPVWLSRVHDEKSEISMN
jgi:DNA ligase-1